MDSARPSVFEIWIAAARPRTLPAAVSPVIMGAAIAYHANSFKLLPALSCLGFALLVQIGTNYANDYFDFVKGADTAARVGPRRAVAAGLVSPNAMRWATIFVFAAAFALGMTLLRFGGWPLLVIGVASIFCGIAYTGGPYPLGYNGLGDLFVFIFFGLVAVCATCFVQVGRVPLEAWVAGAGVGALAVNILLLNNYRDAETDALAGKKTVVVRFGKRYARRQYDVALAFAFAAPLVLFANGYAAGALLCLLTVPLGWLQRRKLASATAPSELIALLGASGQLLALYAVLFAIGVAATR